MASSGRRRARVLALLGIVLALFAACSFFGLRLSTRSPGTFAQGTAPDFSLYDTTGKVVTLASLTARGPAVLVFYRGYW